MKNFKLFLFSLAVSICIVAIYAVFTMNKKLDYTKFLPIKQVELDDFAGKDIRIYEVYHREAPFLASDVVIPIHAGRALHFPYGAGLETLMIGDDTGDNISEKNLNFAELTVLYWMWKNVNADYAGLMHYRRSFTIEGNTFRCQDYLCATGLNKKNLSKLFDKYDILMPKKAYVLPTVYQHYVDMHYKEDIDMALDYIRGHYPEMADDIEPALMVPKGYFGNMFIMKKEIMDEYAAWLFDILFALEDKLAYELRDTKTAGIDCENENDYQRRTEGYLGERLFNVWLYHNRNKYKIGELDVLIRDKRFSL